MTLIIWFNFLSHLLGYVLDDAIFQVRKLKLRFNNSPPNHSASEEKSRGWKPGSWTPGLSSCSLRPLKQRVVRGAAGSPGGSAWGSQIACCAEGTWAQRCGSYLKFSGDSALCQVPWLSATWCKEPTFWDFTIWALLPCLSRSIVTLQAPFCPRAFAPADPLTGALIPQILTGLAVFPQESAQTWPPLRVSSWQHYLMRFLCPRSPWPMTFAHSLHCLVMTGSCLLTWSVSWLTWCHASCLIKCKLCEAGVLTVWFIAVFLESRMFQI